jgi:hypothetical protein
MARALIVMVLTLAALVFSYRLRVAPSRHRPTPDVARALPVTVANGRVTVDAPDRLRALTTLLGVCTIGGAALGLGIVVALTTLTGAVSGLLR